MKVIKVSAQEVVEYLENQLDCFKDMTVGDFVEYLKERLEEE